MVWMFQNRDTGRFTVAQFPNAALALFLATLVVERVIDRGDVPGVTVRWTGTLALGWWAVAELRSGVNPWRRILGFLGCAAVGVRTASLLG